MARLSDRLAAPAAFFREHVEALAAAARRGPILDLACGGGRHTLAGLARGLPMVGLDRSRERLATLVQTADAQGLPARAVCADLERAGAGMPLAPGRFGAVLVFRYLHRPLCDAISALLAPGGVLLYETFTVAQRARGTGPRRDAFLLVPGELPRLFPELVCEVFEEGPSHEPAASETARLLARRPPAA